ncbi:MAG TPA: glycosyl hydrolase 53 family protein [Flavobacteriales bacterium]|nr:glycosyl hydrolase 53 family protein [Flavobacteriales bacterium]
MINQSKLIFHFSLLLLLFSCSKTELASSTKSHPIDVVAESDSFIRGIDISSLPEIETGNTSFFSSLGIKTDLLSILKDRGVNTIRIRLWKDPVKEHSGFEEVKLFSQRVHQMGMKVWLTVHYSDTWADPGHQQMPVVWSNVSYSNLKDSLNHYTTKIMQEIQPEFIQIGNEINPGMLLPAGEIVSRKDQLVDLLNTCTQAVRAFSNQTRIVIHFAGLENASWFFNQISEVDYDVMGLSYYPIWHGKDLDVLQNTLNTLVQTYSKDIVVAETAYPFTLGWNDWTNNVVGGDDQLILPDYPASPEGQKQFVNRIRSIVENTPRGIGFIYWGGELVSTQGPESTQGSTWENQAVFDFTNKELPVLEAFHK